MSAMGSALVLHPGVDGAVVTSWITQLGLQLWGTQRRGDRQFCEHRFGDDQGCEVLYREDHVLGLRIVFVTGRHLSRVSTLTEELGARLPSYTLEEALAAAQTAQLSGRPAARVAMLGPLVALLAYSLSEDPEEPEQADEQEAVAYELLMHCLQDPEPAVRRATLRGAAYLLTPTVTELLHQAMADPDLAGEARRQVALRAQTQPYSTVTPTEFGNSLDEPEVSIDYVTYLQSADAHRATGQLSAALIDARIALAVARRMGVRLHKMVELTNQLIAQLDGQLRGAMEDAFLPVQALLVHGRFHEVDEIATALLDLEMSVKLRVTLLGILAEGLRGRGRPDLAEQAQEQAQALLAASPSST
jgi:hypothetical protein